MSEWREEAGDTGRRNMFLFKFRRDGFSTAKSRVEIFFIERILSHNVVMSSTCAVSAKSNATLF